MNTQTPAPPDMFATATAPPVDADGSLTTSPVGVPMSRVIGVLAVVVALVGGLALWSVSPRLALTVLGVVALVAGLALVAPWLASRRGGKAKKRRRDRSRRSWRDRLPRRGWLSNWRSGGRSRPGGDSRFRLPAPGSSPRFRRSDGGAGVGAPGAPQTRLARMRQRFSKREADSGAPGASARSRWHSPLQRRKQTTTSDDAGSPGRMRRARSVIRTSAARMARPRSSSSVPPGAKTKDTTSGSNQAAHRNPSTRGGPKNTPGTAKQRAPRHQQWHRIGAYPGQNRPVMQARHPIKSASALAKHSRKGDGKPPEKQSRWQWWTSRPQPAVPPKQKSGPKDKASPQPGQRTEKSEAPTELSDPGPPIQWLTGDDAGFPYVPPPVHDRSSAASAFNDMGPTVPRERSTPVTTTPDASTRATRADTYEQWAVAAENDIARLGTEKGELEGQIAEIQAAAPEGEIADTSRQVQEIGNLDLAIQDRQGRAAAWRVLGQEAATRV